MLKRSRFTGGTSRNAICRLHFFLEQETLHRCQLSRIWRDSPEFLLLLSRVPTFCRLSRHNIRRILPSIRRSIVNIPKVPNYRQESRFFRGFAPESFFRKVDTYETLVSTRHDSHLTSHSLLSVDKDI